MNPLTPKIIHTCNSNEPTYKSKIAKEYPFTLFKYSIVSLKIHYNKSFVFCLIYLFQKRKLEQSNPTKNNHS